MYAETSGPLDAKNPRFLASGGPLGGRMYAEISGPPDAENLRFLASGGPLGCRMQAETSGPPDAENPRFSELIKFNFGMNRIPLGSSEGPELSASGVAR